MRWLPVLGRSRSESLIRWTLAVALSLAILGCATATPKKGRLLTYEEVARVWIGVSEDELCLLRLSLKPDSTGLGAYSFLDKEQHVFGIPSWTYEAARLHIAVEPTDQTHWRLEPLRGSVVGDAMQLTMTGEGWNRTFTLRREEELVRRWNKLRDSMDRAEAEITP
jgi:hypothetical protein